MRAPLLLVPALLLAACGGEEAPRDKYVSPDKPGLSDSARAAVNALPDTARVYFNMANRHCDTVPPPEFKPRGDEDPATDFGRAVTWMGKRLRKRGLADVTDVVYRGLRHETLLERQDLRQRPVDDFCRWCQRVTRQNRYETT